MTPAQASEILRQHNAWRRDNDDEAPLEQVNPIRLGKAIDAAVAFIKATGQAAIPRVQGVSRVSGSPQGLLVSFATEPTDIDLINIHEWLRSGSTQA